MSSTWDEIVARLPAAHILQTQEWGRVKIHNGWRPQYMVWVQNRDRGQIEVHRQDASSWETISGSIKPEEVAAASLLLIRSAGAPVKISVAYCPKGPLLDWQNQALRRRVLSDLADAAHQEGVILLKIDPDVTLGEGVPGSADGLEDALGSAVVDDLGELGWQESEEEIQFRNTVELDLTPPLEEIMAGFKQKTRYNIRLAERRGVRVRVGGRADLENLYQLYADTSMRDGFTIRELPYYRNAWGSFLREGQEPLPDTDHAVVPVADPLVAEVEGEAIAGLILYRFARKAWFLFGMSSTEHREKMPGYLLQWEAIIRAKAAGCMTYDLWGAPDEFSESDPMWGVYRFKEGFRGTVVRHIGAWDLPVRPRAYALYTRVLPRILDVMRFRGGQRTRGAVG